MEEIIIDGVNVAGCYWKCEDGDCAMYYADLSADNNELEFGFNCEDNTDCYFKQLKRLEQENAELKTVHKQLKQMIKSKESLLEKAIKENAELKEKIAELQRKYSKQYQINENKGYLKAERILEEISGILDVRFVDGLNEEAEIYNQDMDRIRNKINEVLNKGAEE